MNQQTGAWGFIAMAGLGAFAPAGATTVADLRPSPAELAQPSAAALSPSMKRPFVATGVPPGDPAPSGSWAVSTQPTPGALSIARDGGWIRITFSGVLVSAPTLHGPWTHVSGAASPYVVGPAGTAPRFYQAQAAGADSVFSSRTVLEWTLTGPFQPHFNLAFAGMPDGIFPPLREKPYFGGAVTMGDFELPATLRVRGNSSLQECPFPKLKLKVSKKDREGTPFADAREIKVGTHCAEGGSGTVGRLRDETATFREALAYEVLDAFGFTAPRVRRARIEYRDTSIGDPEQPGGWHVTRQAMILEDAEVLGERLGGRSLTDEEIEAIRDARFDRQLITDLHLFHALLGNWDYVLSEKGDDLWNIDVIEKADGALLPVVGDFDLASWVSGRVLSNEPPNYHPELDDVERRVRYEVEQLREGVGESAFAAGRERFVSRRDEVEALMLGGDVDEAGRTLALRHLNGFFDALNAVAAR